MTMQAHACQQTLCCPVLPCCAQVPAAAGNSTLRSDAAVNAANVMCSLAELCDGGSEGKASLAQAVQLYQSALVQEEDAAVSDMCSKVAAAADLGQPAVGCWLKLHFVLGKVV